MSRGRDTLGLLTESTILPRKGTALEGVSGASMSALSIAIAAARCPRGGAAADHAAGRKRARLELGPPNAGVAARASADDAAAAAEERAGAAAIHVKALVYALLTATTADAAAAAAAALKGVSVPPALRAQVEAALGSDSGAAPTAAARAGAASAALEWGDKRAGAGAGADAAARAWAAGGGSARPLRSGIGFDSGAALCAQPSQAPDVGVVTSAWQHTAGAQGRADLAAVAADTAVGRARVAEDRGRAVAEASGLPLLPPPPTSGGVSALLSAAVVPPRSALLLPASISAPANHSLPLPPTLDPAEIEGDKLMAAAAARRAEKRGRAAAALAAAPPPPLAALSAAPSLPAQAAAPKDPVPPAREWGEEPRRLDEWSYHAVPPPLKF